MNIRKISEEEKDEETAAALSLSENDFTFGKGRVQGAKLGRCANTLLIKDAERFKLYADGTDVVFIEKGNGHFKWKKGETPFRAGDCFAAEHVGEYEVNGSPCFRVIRK